MVICMVALYVGVFSSELDISGYIGAGRGASVSPPHLTADFHIVSPSPQAFSCMTILSHSAQAV
jgi:hypothetical protein